MKLEQTNQMFTMMFVETVVDKIVDNLVNRDKHVLFLTTKASLAGKTKIIDIGVFGNVFVTKRLDK